MVKLTDDEEREKYLADSKIPVAPIILPDGRVINISYWSLEIDGYKKHGLIKVKMEGFIDDGKAEG